MAVGRIASDSATWVARSAIHVFPNETTAAYGQTRENQPPPSSSRVKRGHRPGNRGGEHAEAGDAEDGQRWREVHPEREVLGPHVWHDDVRQPPGELAGQQESRDSCPAASTSTSTNICMTIRPRLAPSAVRAANSSRLVTVRAYTRIAIFVHGGTRRRALSRMMPPPTGCRAPREDARGIRHDARLEMFRRSGNGSPGNNRTSRASACARSSVAPGTRRAKMKRPRFQDASIDGADSQRRPQALVHRESDPSGITPTTMCGVSPTWMRWPRAPGSDENLIARCS